MAISTVVPGSVNAPLGTQNQSGVNNAGGLNIIEVTGLSSDITVAPINILTAYNGNIEIEQVIVKTDPTGLAGGTNFVIGTDDALGLATILSEAVANLGANKTVDMFTASLVKQRTVIAQGKHIQINSTVAACTGGGKWAIYIVYRPTNSVASLS